MLFMMPVRIIKLTNGFLPVNYSLINVFFFFFFFFTPHFLKQGHSQNTGDKCYLFSATYLISSYNGLKVRFNSVLFSLTLFSFLLQLGKRQSYFEKLDNGAPIRSAHQLLQHIAEIVNLFNLKCPLTNISDIRLKKLNSFYSFMLDWREKSTDHNSSFISSKLGLDLQSMCLGFHALVQVKLQYFLYSCIRPAIVNQDCVENHFCQERSCNGQNNNPTYNQQQ
ncbi:unnamed protein product [Pocillopora meandrina]|uniref:Uncharacterized protein n=1 Tax=Pocillopora meandrina TaxID=46732 RepID=A0AAU9VX71_9CNID|nr:unnamed protein product [Pocillopora meandrina]